MSWPEVIKNILAMIGLVTVYHTIINGINGHWPDGRMHGHRGSTVSILSDARRALAIQSDELESLLESVHALNRDLEYMLSELDGGREALTEGAAD